MKAYYYSSLLLLLLLLLSLLLFIVAIYKVQMKMNNLNIFTFISDKLYFIYKHFFDICLKYVQYKHVFEIEFSIFFNALTVFFARDDIIQRLPSILYILILSF